MKPNIICLTAVRNNIVFLQKFLSSTSLWADYIIICDQMSTDGSRELVKKFEKVILIDNKTKEWNEIERQRLLINEARKIEGQSLLITLDVDEIFTPNFLSSAEWETMLNSRPGTIIKFQWANFRPDLKTMWLGYHFPWGYMDDGVGYYDYEISEKSIHCGRIPLPDNHEILVMNQIKVIHFQYVDWNKMKSKHRWYQCYEAINFPNTSKLDLFRKYHHMEVISKDELEPIPFEWINDYNKLGIDITSVLIEANNWFEEQVVDLIEKHGNNAFRKLNIWDINWVEKSNIWGKTDIQKYKDPRTKVNKLIHKWLYKTQGKQNKLKYRVIDKLIKTFFDY